MVFPRLLGWVGTIVNGSTRYRRGRLDTAFSYEKAYKTILTLSLTKHAPKKPGNHLAWRALRARAVGFLKVSEKHSLPRSGAGADV